MRELLGSDAGAVVPVGDWAGLADAVVERLRHPGLAEDEGRAGRQRAEGRHTLSMSTGSVARLYEEFLARRGGSRQAPRS
jgi:glycosyltransferase involved in cell wall biosynthesis